MVTLAVPERLAFVKSSVSDYLRQSYPNKELLAVVNGADADARTVVVRYLASLGRADIRLVEIEHALTLGQLRAISLEQARGEVVCQWDDDDRHHPDRVAHQLQALLGGPYEAVYLQDVLQYFPQRRRLYWTRWSQTEARAHPGTLMTWRGTPIHYPTEGAEADLGEDLHVALALNARGGVGRLEGMAHLFVYVSHGANSWSDSHHRMLADRLSISKALLLRRKANIREGLRPIQFAAYPVQVWGANGLAFEIDRESEGGTLQGPAQPQAQ